MSVILYHTDGDILRHAEPYFGGFSGVLHAILFGGRRGVPLFFVISGFVLARPFAEHYLEGKHKPTLRKYFLRRITRLEPPYILNILVLSVAAVVVSHDPAWHVLGRALASIGYLHHAIFREPSTINPAAWSLEIEVQFYILAPFLTMLFAIPRKAIRRSVILALLIMSGILGSLMHLDPTTLPGQIGYFLAGLLLADLFLAAKRRKQDWRWDVVSLLGWPVVFLGPQAGIQLWLPCLTILLYIAAYHGLVLPRFLGNAWIAVTGGMCYTIYLWHASMISIVERVIARLPLAGTHNYFALLVIRLVLDLPLIAGTSLLLYILVERPCMDPQWPRKLGGFLKQARWPLIRSRRPVIFPS